MEVSPAIQTDRALDHMLSHQPGWSSLCTPHRTTLHGQVAFISLHYLSHPMKFHSFHSSFLEDPFPKFHQPYDELINITMTEESKYI